MLLKIAWRNIWRSRTRSLVVIGAIVIGVWAEIFLMSFSLGMVKSYINNAIHDEISHIQLHHPEFQKEKEIEYYIEDAGALRQSLESAEHVKAATVRSLSGAMLSSAKGARGVQAKGVDPATESAVTGLDQKIVEGTYFEAGKRNQILLGKSLAEKMNVKLRSKVVLTFTNLEGDITAGAFRVAGLYKTNNTLVDDAQVFVTRDDFNQVLGREGIAHEAAIFLDDPSYLPAVQQALQASYPALLAESYEELAPEMALFDSSMRISTSIFTVILMLALIFGIINTMLMAVLERIKELGMLMAVGMKKGKVFSMIMLETVMLGVVATPIGLALAFVTVKYFNTHGIDLSSWSEAMRQFGMGGLVYTVIQPDLFLELTVAVLVTALIGSIYPALKAIRLRPVEAIRRI